MHGVSNSDIGIGALLIGIIAIGLSIVAIAEGGSPSSGGDKQQLDTGWTGCTIPAGQSTCSMTVTFHKIFPQPPNVTLTFAADPFSGTSISIPNTLDIIAAGTLGDTWPAMPNAVTEIFGSTKNRFFFGGLPTDVVSNQLFFTVNVAAAGSANSMLEVQLTNDDVNWFDVASPAGSCDVSIATVGLQVGSCSLVSPSTLATYFHGRIAGFGGNGIATPSFGLVTVQFQAPITFSSVLVALSITTTGFSVSVISPIFAISDSAYIISWIGLGCLNGGKQC